MRVDTLQSKVIRNQGEEPRYYIENHHEGIIKPKDWEDDGEDQKVKNWWNFRKDVFDLNPSSESENNKIVRVKHNNLEFSYKFPSINDDQKEYYYSLTLFNLLKGDAFKSGVNIFTMYNWKDVQTFFNQAYFPSTIISSMLVNTLNMHRNVYKDFYHLIDDKHLPYRDLLSAHMITPIQTTYLEWIDNYLKRAQKNLLTENGGTIEMIRIDVDMLTKDGD